MKNLTRYLTATAVFTVLASVGVASLGVTPGVLFASGSGEDEPAEYGKYGEREDDRRHPGRNALVVRNYGYRDECGSCHLAYPPELLPARSWRVLMQGLDRHFGDNAEVDAQTATRIEAYLVANAATGDRYRRAAGLSRVSDGSQPRITATRYFQRKHDEVPQRLVKDNSEVGSFSNCQACHSGAERGDFDEDRVRIPGAGRWND